MDELEEEGWVLPADASGSIPRFPALVLGLDENDGDTSVDLAGHGHLLIIGPSGSGKSFLLHHLVTQILTTHTPDEVRLILSDMSGAEWSSHSKLPHLLTPVITNTTKLTNTLAWTTKEIDRRLDLLSEFGLRDINGLNDLVRSSQSLKSTEEQEFEHHPHIVVIVDSIDEVFNTENDSVKYLLTQVANRGCRVGVFLIIAVHPSIGRYLLNQIGLSLRLVLRMASSDMRSFVDRDIISSSPDRYVAQLVESFPHQDHLTRLLPMDFDSEHDLIKHWQRQCPELVFVETDKKYSDNTKTNSLLLGQDDDELLRQAMEIVVRSGIGSTALLQRKLKVGFARAGRLIDLLEEIGAVGPAEGSKSRTVLMSTEELDAWG
jgi:S-DNA-T family DNA segregation ATPase FtsK/SpoIIIE